MGRGRSVPVAFLYDNHVKNAELFTQRRGMLMFLLHDNFENICAFLFAFLPHINHAPPYHSSRKETD